MYMYYTDYQKVHVLLGLHYTCDVQSYCINCSLDVIEQVGSEATDGELGHGTSQLERRDDVLPHHGRGRGCESHDGYRGEQLPQFTQPPVASTKVMAPC